MSGQIFAAAPAMKKVSVVNRDVYESMKEQVFRAILKKISADYYKSRADSTLTVFNAIEIAPLIKGVWAAQTVPLLLRMMADAGDIELVVQMKKVEYIGPVVKYRLKSTYPFLEEKGRFFHKILDIKKLDNYVQSIDPYRIKNLSAGEALEAIGVKVKVRPEPRQYKKPGPARNRWV